MTQQAQDLDTPSLYIDLDILERNIRVMQERCREWGVALRPHAKTHKIAEIARMQLAAGAVGLTVAKIGELEVLPGDDFLIGYPLTPEKLPRLREAAKGRRVSVVTDSAESARALTGIPALVEIDAGIGRCGVGTPEACVAVARACDRFEGVFYWPSDLDEAGFRRGARLVADCIAALKAAGLPPRTVSGGSTPGARWTTLSPETTEVRPGTYVFQDATTVAEGVCAVGDCALRVLVSVVSTAVPGRCIVDGGSKTFSSDRSSPPGTFGLLPDRSWKLIKLNEEHGIVQVDGGPAPRVGEKIWVIPNHICPAVNLHDSIFYGRAGRVEGAWPVTARGRVR